MAGDRGRATVVYGDSDGQGMIGMEVPRTADLEGLSVAVEPLGDPGIVAVTAWANDGAVATLTWDELASAIRVRWIEGENMRLSLEREFVARLSIREERGAVEFWIWSESEGLGGQLVVRIGDQVTVSDVILRR